MLVQSSWGSSLVVGEEVVPQQTVCYDITQRDQLEWRHFAYLQRMRDRVCDPKGVDGHIAKGLGEILPGTLGEDCVCDVHADLLGSCFMKSLCVREESCANTWGEKCTFRISPWYV